MNVYRIFSRLLAVFVLCSMAAAAVQADDTPKPGKDFAALPASVASSKPTGEFIEFFMYQCPHCMGIFDSGTAWAPRGASLRRVPAVFNEFQLDYARMYYALEQLNASADVHLAVMRAIQVEKKPLRTKEEQAAFLAGHGIDAARYASAWESIGVALSARRAAELSRQFGLTETPAMVINGQYLTSRSMAGDVDAMHKIASYVNSAQKSGNKAALAGGAAPASGSDSPASGTAGNTGKTQISGKNKWPAGVEPGNLYILSYGLSRNSTYDSTILVSARTQPEAVALLQKALAQHNEGKDPASAYWQVIKGVPTECTGPNWGATVSFSPNAKSFVSVTVCGARTPREAIEGAAKYCAEKHGRPCNLVKGGEADGLIVSIGHSGAKPWGGLKSGFGGPHVGGWPNPGMSFAALGASTQQFSGSQNQYIQTPEDSLRQFGKACGASEYGRDTHSCWITSKNLECVWTIQGENQHKCVDAKLTAEGYFP